MGYGMIFKLLHYAVERKPSRVSTDDYVRESIDFIASYAVHDIATDGA